ncbi:MAG TPA: NAD(P)/FAD-dependent oxidoreductase [Blastocatellia bacterium]|nr:NAD(P)/FAD-dependent oxidoreductase [Blastocatellia bacterium]
MNELSTEIAIVGAGPAGAHLASRLAAEGRDVVLFDPKGAWEKPCGGGVPTRAIREFSYLLESSNYPCKLVRHITLFSPLDRRVSLTVDEPFAIYSRQVLNGLVLDRAVAAGARFERAGVADLTRDREVWKIRTDKADTWSARFLVGADGAASFTRRRLVGIFAKQDLALAFGYNVKDEAEDSRTNGARSRVNDEVIVRFPKDFTGYLWAFPRPGVMNFGVASKLGERTSDELRGLLSKFVSDYYGGRTPDPERVSFFGAKIPTLDFATWKGLQTTGEGWALIGDAAGFCDPITGEGIYYAFKSGDLLADALSWATQDGRTNGNVPNESTTLTAGLYARANRQYEAQWRESFGRELENASARLPRFYRGFFLGQIFTDAMIRFARHHRGVRTVLGRAITGDQSYVTLKRDLLRSALRVF